jgi:hypothetical protein
MEEENCDVMDGSLPTCTYNFRLANLNCYLTEVVIKFSCPTDMILFKPCDHFRIKCHFQEFMGTSNAS